MEEVTVELGVNINGSFPGGDVGTRHSSWKEQLTQRLGEIVTPLGTLDGTE